MEIVTAVPDVDAGLAGEVCLVGGDGDSRRYGEGCDQIKTIILPM